MKNWKEEWLRSWRWSKPRKSLKIRNGEFCDIWGRFWWTFVIIMKSFWRGVIVIRLIFVSGLQNVLNIWTWPFSSFGWCLFKPSLTLFPHLIVTAVSLVWFLAAWLLYSFSVCEESFLRILQAFLRLVSLSKWFAIVNCVFYCGC